MSKDKNFNQDSDLQNYHDPAGLTIKKMNFGLWLSENRKRIAKVVTVILIILCVFFFVYSSYNFIIYLITGDPSKQMAIDNFTNSPRKVADDLKVSPINIFRSGERFDLTVKISNPNVKFKAEFNYCFNRGVEKVFCGSDFILPSDDKYLSSLGQELDATATNLSFQITDVFWQRVNAHQIPDWSAFSAGRLDLAIFDITWQPASSANNDPVSLNSLEFKIKNQTPFSYYEVPLNILALSGSELAGVNRYVLIDFLSGEERTVKMIWTGNLRFANRIEIKPDLNILDNDVYLDYQGANK